MDAISKLNKIFLRRAGEIIDQTEHKIPALGYYIIGWFLGFELVIILFRASYHDFFSLRIIEMILALPLVLYNHLNGTLRKIFPYHYIFYMLCCIPVFLFYCTMNNDWDPIWSMATLGGIILLVVIISDWLFISLFITLSFAIAYLTTIYQTGTVSFVHFDPLYLSIYIFTLSGGMLVTRWKEERNNNKISLMKSLSGTIAHEMRTPLQTITLAIDSVASILSDKPDHSESHPQSVTIPVAELDRIRTIIDQSGETIKRSNKIIDSILASLNGSEVDRRHFRFHQASAVISMAVNNYSFNDLNEKSLVQLDLSQDFEFLGDRELFSHMLFNLLNNAIYYRHKPGFSIKISTTTGENSNQIRIRDTGPGVPANKREVIFNQFYTYGKNGGNGLGLAFCRRVAESFGGTITCLSETGEWTEFVIDLPSAESKNILQLKNEILTGRQILIVDDQAINRLLLSKFVNGMNCRTEQAENGKSAIEMAAAKTYDLILMDIEMPVLNGDEAVNRLREGTGIPLSLKNHYREIPIIGVTALPAQDARQRCLSSGMDDYLLKPIKQADLRKVIDRYFFYERPAKERPPLPGVTKASILLADDNVVIRELLKAMLEPQGYQIYQSEHGRMALDLLKDMPIDLVIMDLEMPVLGGLDTAAEIRNNSVERLRSIPIIALSGHTDWETIAKTQQAGIDLHLGKPVQKHELLSAVAKLVSHDAV